MVSGHADDIARLQGNVVAMARLVGVDGDLVVGVLTSEVVDVVQGVEEGGRIRMQHLHELVGHAANLRRQPTRCSSAHIYQLGIIVNDSVFRINSMTQFSPTTVDDGFHNINKLLSQDNRLIKDANDPSVLVKTQ